MRRRWCIKISHQNYLTISTLLILETVSQLWQKKFCCYEIFFARRILVVHDRVQKIALNLDWSQKFSDGSQINLREISIRLMCETRAP